MRSINLVLWSHNECLFSCLNHLCLPRGWQISHSPARPGESCWKSLDRCTLSWWLRRTWFRTFCWARAPPICWVRPGFWTPSGWESRRQATRTPWWSWHQPGSNCPRPRLAWTSERRHSAISVSLFDQFCRDNNGWVCLCASVSACVYMCGGTVHTWSIFSWSIIIRRSVHRTTKNALSVILYSRSSIFGISLMSMPTFTTVCVSLGRSNLE